MNLLTGPINTGQYMYYTIQSNLLALILFGMLLVRTIKGLRSGGAAGSASYFPRFEMVCVIDLLLTMLVYWVMLAPGAFSMSGGFDLWGFDNLTVHMITPLLCIADYVLFADSGHLKYRDVYYVTIFPLSYVAYSSIAGLLGYVYRTTADGVAVRFPYFFYDFDTIGAQSFLYISALVLFFLLISHGLYWLDKKVQKPVLWPRTTRSRHT